MSWPRRGPHLDAALPMHVHTCIEGEYLVGVCFVWIVKEQHFSFLLTLLTLPQTAAEWQAKF